MTQGRSLIARGRNAILKKGFSGRLARKTAGVPGAQAGAHAFGPLWCTLNPGWRVFRNCYMAAAGEQYRIDFVILHQLHGIALITLAPPEYAVPEIAVRVARSMLREAGFDRLFRGFLPVAFVALDERDREDMLSVISTAFEETAPITVGNPNWSEWAAGTFDLVARPVEAPDPDPIPSAEAEWLEPSPPRRPAFARLGHRPKLVLGVAALLGASAAATFVLLHPGFGERPPREASNQALASVLGLAVQAAQASQAAPRLMSEARVASYLGLDLAGFHDKVPLLRKQGFPLPEPITGNYDKAAVDRWLDRIGGAKRNEGA